MSSHNAVPFGLTGTITGILGGGCGLLSVKDGEESGLVLLVLPCVICD